MMAGFNPRGYGKNKLGAVRQGGARYGGNQNIGNYIGRRFAQSAVSPKAVKVHVKTVVKPPKAVGVKHTVKAITPPQAGRVRWFR
jgi:hypothetical protein